MHYDKGIYTVESVSSGHPDKVCDQISDAILDECLRQDPKSRVAVEVFGSHGLIVIGGEVTTKAKVNYKKIALAVYKKIGYKKKPEVIVHVAQQSPDIAMGVDTGGAGDQGIMYGYATNETKEMMPGAVVNAHKLVKGLEELRKSGKADFLGPDAKSQITMDNDKVKTVLISTQHKDDVNPEDIKEALMEILIEKVIGDLEGVEVLVNPTGKFVLGGFDADTGLSGRKIQVDTYGGLIPHGGGAFSGKDPSKVDRSAAYMSRYAAKQLVSRGLGDKILVSVAYAIGRAEPLMVKAVNNEGDDLSSKLVKSFDFSPRAIIEQLDLLRPIYEETAAYGHFGKAGLPWEEIG